MTESIYGTFDTFNDREVDDDVSLEDLEAAAKMYDDLVACGSWGAWIKRNDDAAKCFGGQTDFVRKTIEEKRV
jgi:hypothetical protein